MAESQGAVGWAGEMSPEIQSSQNWPVAGGQSHDHQRMWELSGFS